MEKKVPYSKVNHHERITCHVDVILNQRLSVLRQPNEHADHMVCHIKNTQKALFPSSGVERACVRQTTSMLLWNVSFSSLFTYGALSLTFINFPILIHITALRTAVPKTGSH